MLGTIKKAGIYFDNSPERGSENAVTSNGIFETVNNLQEQIDAISVNKEYIARQNELSDIEMVTLPPSTSDAQPSGDTLNCDYDGFLNIRVAFRNGGNMTIGIIRGAVTTPRIVHYIPSSANNSAYSTFTIPVKKGDRLYYRIFSGSFIESISTYAQWYKLRDYSFR